MLKRFGLTGIGGRLAAVVGLFAIGMIALVAMLSYLNAESVQQARRDQLKAVTDAAYGVVERQYKDAQDGKISLQEAQDRAKAALRSMRYNKNDYFFVLDDTAKSVVHGARPSWKALTNRKWPIRPASTSRSNW